MGSIERIISVPSRALRSFVSDISLDTTCGSCGGDGSVEIVRDRRLDELTNKQTSFLYEAQMERLKSIHGSEEDVKEQTGNVRSPRSQPVSYPSGGGPPVMGGTRNF